MITIYTRESCSKCNTAKALLETRKVEYEEKNIDRYRDYLLSKYPSLKELPVIFLDGNLLGGLQDLNEYVRGIQDDKPEEAV